MNAVTIHGVSKTYDNGTVKALDAVSFEVKTGELFGLIGPDGAGKTSLIRILATLLLADQGEASLAGFDVVKDYRQIRNRIGYMPGKFSLYQDLTIEENLQFFARVFNTTVGENYELIKDTYEQIRPFSQRRAGKLSGGMKQKLALCCALIHKPQVLLLDEPTTGVDVVSRKEFWDMLKTLRAQGITILVSTPYMDEANLCERIALIQEGKILSVDTPQNVIRAFPGTLYSARARNIYHLLTDLRRMPEVATAYAFGENLHITLQSDVPDGVALLRSYAKSRGHTAVETAIIEPGIEDSFIALMHNQS